MELTIHTDGGSRGNPGPSAVGVVIDTPTTSLAQFGKYIGVGTNNQAEYEAVIAALEWVQKNAPEVKKINFFLDSQLVVSQLTGVYKIKHPHMIGLKQKIDHLLSALPTQVTFRYVPREQNKTADSLVNQALDAPNFAS